MYGRCIRLFVLFFFLILIFPHLFFDCKQIFQWFFRIRAVLFPLWSVFFSWFFVVFEFPRVFRVGTYWILVYAKRFQKFKTPTDLFYFFTETQKDQTENFKSKNLTSRKILCWNNDDIREKTEPIVIESCPFVDPVCTPCTFFSWNFPLVVLFTCVYLFVYVCRNRKPYSV